MKINYFFIIFLLILVPTSATVYLKDATTSSLSCATCDGTGLIVTGNVTADYFIGDGSQLTGLVAIGGSSPWIDAGNYLVPNSTFADNVLIEGNLNVSNWGNVSITESQISDLAHIGNCSGSDCVIGCGNITGNTGDDLCTVSNTDTTIGNCSVDGSCETILYESGGTMTGNLLMDTNDRVCFRDCTDQYIASYAVSSLGIYADTNINMFLGGFSDLTIETTGTTIGSSAPGVDYILKFDGESSDGVIQWLEDEEQLTTLDDWKMSSTKHIMFGDSTNNISSPSTGLLNIKSQNKITSKVKDMEIEVDVNSINFLNGTEGIIVEDFNSTYMIMRGTGSIGGLLFKK